jgi:hypothetical protein
VKCLRVLFVTLVAAAISASAAVASSPHFVGTPTCSFSSSGVLTCSGKAAGLGNDAVTAQLSTSGGTVTWECVNHGKNVAPGQPLAVAPQSGQGQAITPHNGAINFSPTIVLTQPDVSSYCPNGKTWTLRLLSASLNDVTISIYDASDNVLLEQGFGTISFP